MENELKIGEYNHLRIIKEVPFGLYLDGYEDEILLPLQYVPETYEIDQFIDVFIYRDSEDRIIATTLKPKATIDQFAYLEVKAVTPLGVFMEWGLAKDLFVPFSQQFQKMSVGRSYLVYIYLDGQTDRIVASARVEKFLPLTDGSEFTIGDKVDAIPFEHTDLGIKCLVNNCKIGMLFKNQVFTNLTFGESTSVYIANIRPDGKLDLRLEAVGMVRIDSQAERILAAIKENNGVLMLHDKSPAEDIYQQFGMSKKDFKKGVGALYKSKLIALHNDCISLL
ncbi:CvfB family protein [Aquirufa regiilacus]|uniref:S1-like domain-containing RNA-binding protein n=1 Tax=Aquirufa regiilacus TaxID=3024868 RepID=A0ABU3TQ49_9BACT|nr:MULTISPECIES: S1-like domain-containing RNA-binding protein [unclassified Aquirufa]MDT8887337.1 S1-like domain-containing RNA-binding protein [Aquirufa sp. LEPPI-3A]MDU0807989.1 S1-like domain-containing RNA-binding protein [Aquirufa sp. LEOWEIH-7C]